ncbi:beta-propeller fold lactonase family protein [Pseudoalteromonas luteoviolacea]|uniref:beta-propeller fold lactonase family protein n=1 Tax=Pseudoalteromonas luteoviolacea TaxID=43657 RepID=UPI001150DB66|nr:beta-propeller fold lactonase family protein [Pseudoalteromonas luteoviolacea]TQF70640.1 lactonase family protein [Pseudoalteromonas luteoviolacea]
MTKYLYFLILWPWVFSANVEASNSALRLKQVLQNNLRGVSGISNPRDIAIAQKRGMVLVVSGDDDALTVFSADEDFKLSLSQSFSDKNFPELRLKGASSVSYSKRHHSAYTTSFYSGALTSFSYKDEAQLLPTTTLSDNINHNLVFKSFDSIKAQDSLGLLGAWSSVITNDGQYLLTASYQSNTVSVFSLAPKGVASFKTKLLPNHDWGHPTSIEQTADSNTIFVAGFESNQIFILNRTSDHHFVLKQTLSHPTLLNPQKLSVSRNGEYLFVAAAKSKSLIIYKQDTDGQYLHHQSILKDQLPSGGLNGACCIAMSLDESLLFISGEADNGILIFNKSKETDQITYQRHIKSIGGIAIENVSVLKTTDDGKHLMVGTGKNNQLLILEIAE